MGRLTAALLAAVAAAGLSACGEERITETTTTRAPGPSDSIVAYERFGGEVGVRDRLDVRPDGAARVTTLKGARRVQLSPNELDGLRVAREGIDIASLEPLYGTLPPPADTHQWIVQLDAVRTRVLYGGKPPDELRRLIQVCEGIVQRHGPR